MVLAECEPREAVVLPAREALGLVLAEDVASDVDSPPHDKSIVDGYAVIAADLIDGTAELSILEEVAAGAVPRHAVTPGSATRIMTGAPVPEGADAVVMVERSRLVAEDRVLLDDPRVAAGQNIMRRASSMTRGQIVLKRGALVRAIELGVLAEVGAVEARVVRRPTVAILSTGNELVEPTQLPGAGQIRNSNGPLLAAAARAAGAEPIELGIARDDRDSLASAMARGLEHDVLVISGGVSAGVFDLVPGVLAELGVRQVFHKIDLKPGKPLWFGVGKRLEAGDRRPERGRSDVASSSSRLQSPASSLVFGLPGNPVSSFVCFELFARPAIAKLAGRTQAANERVEAVLSREFVQRSGRLTYHPARLDCHEGRWRVDPLVWKGSGDLRTLVAANALAIFPAGEQTFAPGDTIDVLRLA